MDPSIETGKLTAHASFEAVPFLFPAAALDPQKAQLAAQKVLFPTTARAVCAEIGLNWWAALRLHADGWLSFAPDRTPQLDESQEAELRFVGSLVAAGCDAGMLAELLGSLAKPYAYDLRRVYYEWGSRRWRLVPDLRTEAEAVFTDWLELLVSRGDTGTLTGIVELAQDAMARVQNADGEPFLRLCSADPDAQRQDPSPPRG